MASLPEDGRPYFLTDTVTLSGNASDTLTMSVGAGDEFHATAMIVTATSNSFSITAITDEASIPYTNANADNPLTGAMFAISQTNLNEWLDLPVPLVVQSNGKISFNLTDTSGSSNTVRIALLGVRRTI